MSDDADARFERHEEIMTGLARLLEAQHILNARQLEFNQQQVEINQDTKTTLARIETLLARMLRHEENGREA